MDSPASCPVTPKELEPYKPYDNYTDGQLRNNHAFSLEEMAWNSALIYLDGVR
jgi:hypothetical protein